MAYTGRIKQVILIRKDLHMRRGKEIAQGSHASMQFLVALIRNDLIRSGSTPMDLTPVETSWITEGMGKVCLQINSEDDLLDIHKQALDAGIKSYLVRDSGRTEFSGVPTLTACAIGPDYSDRIDLVTGSLKLY